jgi:hypothetical protein
MTTTTMPRVTPDPDSAGFRADSLIGDEVRLQEQDKMWGLSNDRADVTKDQMIRAATAQVIIVVEKGEIRRTHIDNTNLIMDKRMPALLEDIRETVFPPGWSGFRDYGSDIANLVVAAAYLRQEIKRRIMLGEDETRAHHAPDQTYNPAFAPNAVDNS